MDRPVVAEGRYVEILTDREDPVCGGTAAFMDNYMQTVAELLGEELPDRQFVTYQWRNRETNSGHASKNGDRVIIDTNILPLEHELVHAVHLTVWPRSRPFLHEGLATHLDSAPYQVVEWPEGYPLDSLLEADDNDDFNYHEAWFVVSQIILDHGFDGLRELWFAVKPGSSANEIRAAYELIFGQPIEALFEPAEILNEGTPDEVEIPRTTCRFAVCVGDPVPFEGDSLDLAAPTGCEEDELAVGTTKLAPAWDTWRPYVVETDETMEYVATRASSGLALSTCFMRCGQQAGAQALGYPDDGTDELVFTTGPLRIETSRPSADIPFDEPGGVTISRTPM